jgi:hypothetical protein
MRRSLIFLLGCLLPLLAQPLFAQQPKVLAPHRAIPPKVEKPFKAALLPPADLWSVVSG